MSKILFLIPNVDNSSPIKGTKAIIKLLENYYDIKVIAIKKNNNDFFFNKYIFKNLNNNFLIRHFQLRKKIRDFSPDFIFSICFSADLYSFFFLKKYNRVSSIRSNLIKNYSFKFKNNFIGKVFFIIHMFIIKNFFKVIAISPTILKDLKRFRIKNPILIWNFIDEDNFVHIKKNKQIFPYKKIKFVYVGQLIKRKNIEELILIFYHLKKLKIKFEFNIVGEGPLLAKLTALAKKLHLSNHIFFHKYTQKPEIIIKENDFFINNSYSEGVSRAMLESLYLNTPCIVKNLDSNKFIIKDRLNGFLYENSSDLISVIKNIYYKGFNLKHEMYPNQCLKKNVIKVFFEFLNYNKN